MKPSKTAPVVAAPPLSRPLNVGDYMRHGTGGALVRLDRLTEGGRWWISYIGVSPDGVAYRGGSSGAWPSAEFIPAAGALDALAVRAYKALLRETEATETLASARREQEVCAAAILALRETGCRT